MAHQILFRKGELHAIEIKESNQKRNKKPNIYTLSHLYALNFEFHCTPLIQPSVIQEDPYASNSI